ncbi:hypothetical protein C8R45DRAFT_1009708 [Mycena sanguinolenta]|nr:hypothetical protein C8R45DRAFT_1009708 [Mycena sanguinolenta]
MNLPPVLPPELEREIFEITALSDFHRIPCLLRLARRVLEWIEPLLYRVVVVEHSPMADAYRRMLRQKPDVLAKGVQHLLVTSLSNWPKEDVHSLLRLCAPQLLSLAGSPTIYKPTLLPIFSHMTQLRRWVGSLKNLFAGYPAVDLSLPVFHTITHMDILDNFTIENNVVIAGLAVLPCLTHLCLDRSTLGHIPRILARCAHLQVLVFRTFRAKEVADNPPTTDVRFVVIQIGGYWKDWKVGIRGGIDFWAAADEFVARKRLGDIEVSCFLLGHFRA